MDGADGNDDDMMALTTISGTMMKMWPSPTLGSQPRSSAIKDKETSDFSCRELSIRETQCDTYLTNWHNCTAQLK